MKTNELFTFFFGIMKMAKETSKPIGKIEWHPLIIQYFCLFSICKRLHYQSKGH